MAGYAKKSAQDLQWKENRENITLKGRQLMWRVLNEILAEADREFQEALNRGEQLEINVTDQEMNRLFVAAVGRLELDSGK